MYVTREADYAVRCVLHLSKSPEETVPANDISKSMSVPRSFVAKILQRLVKKGIVVSVRGVQGGFQLARKPKDINLLEVIEAIQGPSAANICALNKKTCRLSNTCAVHPVWVEIREMVEKKLKEKDFAALLKK
ncbi:MAG: Rrf2 family transcriptional regulator [Nitrospiraceae bacterium]|nr:MAG: Rrf2 family transcriptional regulator [Nitrospiraceae bacterium]